MSDAARLPIFTPTVIQTARWGEQIYISQDGRVLARDPSLVGACHWMAQAADDLLVGSTAFVDLNTNRARLLRPGDVTAEPTTRGRIGGVDAGAHQVSLCPKHRTGDGDEQVGCPAYPTAKDIRCEGDRVIVVLCEGGALDIPYANATLLYEEDPE